MWASWLLALFNCLMRSELEAYEGDRVSQHHSGFGCYICYRKAADVHGCKSYDNQKQDNSEVESAYQVTFHSVAPCR
jgi:hypothetical protein